MARYWECHKCSTETRAHVAGCRRCGHKRLTPCCGEFYDRFGKDKSSESRRRSGSALDDTPKKLDISHRDLRASKSGDQTAEKKNDRVPHEHAIQEEDLSDVSEDDGPLPPV